MGENIYWENPTKFSDYTDEDCELGYVDKIDESLAIIEISKKEFLSKFNYFVIGCGYYERLNAKFNLKSHICNDEEYNYIRENVPSKIKFDKCVCFNKTTLIEDFSFSSNFFLLQILSKLFKHKHCKAFNYSSLYKILYYKDIAILQFNTTSG